MSSSDDVVNYPDDPTELMFWQITDEASSKRFADVCNQTIFILKIIHFFSGPTHIWPATARRSSH